MKKITVVLSLMFVLCATGTANALVHEYYGGFNDLSEPIAILLMGIGLVWTAGIGRKYLK